MASWSAVAVVAGSRPRDNIEHEQLTYCFMRGACVGCMLRPRGAYAKRGAELDQIDFWLPLRVECVEAS